MRPFVALRASGGFFGPHHCHDKCFTETSLTQVREAPKHIWILIGHPLRDRFRFIFCGRR
jgi:hypothetical protein